MKKTIDFRLTSTSINDLMLTNSDADIIHAERDLKVTEHFSSHYAVVFRVSILHPGIEEETACFL